MTVGDPAPPLTAGTFVRGESISRLAKGTVYVIDFWASWCPSCATSAPSLSNLQKKFADRGLVVIGQNCLDRDEARARAFVEDMGARMAYRVALDDRSAGGKGAMATAWLEAAGRSKLPCVFVVNHDGRIAWIGQPTQVEGPVTAILEGQWDLALAQSSLEQDQRLRAAQAGVNRLAQAGRLGDALARIDELSRTSPELMRGLAPLHVRLLLELGRKAQAATMLDAAIAAGDVQQLDAFASLLLARPDKDLAAAERLAAAAVRASRGEDPTSLLTMARICAAREDYEAAVTWQANAVSKASEGTRAYMQRTLKAYEQRKSAAKPHPAKER